MTCEERTTVIENTERSHNAILGKRCCNKKKTCSFHTTFPQQALSSNLVFLVIKNLKLLDNALLDKQYCCNWKHEALHTSFFLASVFFVSHNTHFVENTNYTTFSKAIIQFPRRHEWTISQSLLMVYTRRQNVASFEMNHHHCILFRCYKMTLKK